MEFTQSLSIHVNWSCEVNREETLRIAASER